MNKWFTLFGAPKDYMISRADVRKGSGLAIAHMILQIVANIMQDLTPPPAQTRSGPSTALRASLTSNIEGLLRAWVGYGMMDVFDFTQDISG